MSDLPIFDKKKETFSSFIELITNENQNKVIITGYFDILYHEKILFLLRLFHQYKGSLIIGVASDELFQKEKKRSALYSVFERKKVLDEFNQASNVIIFDDLELFLTENSQSN